METLQDTDGENIKDLNDSGVQDVGKQTETEDRPAELLDLSDDVLLCILKYCEPMDLKALGFTCPRLGRLIRDRTLWTRVDARSHRTGRARLRWLLAHALGANTVALKLQGHARAARGCLGHVNRKRKEVEEERAVQNKMGKEPAASSSEPGRSQEGPVHGQCVQEVDPLARLQRFYTEQAYAQSRFSGTPTWPEDVSSVSGGGSCNAEGGSYKLEGGACNVEGEAYVAGGGACPAGGEACAGPQFTLTQCSLRQMRARCSLTELALEYCNINCNATGINHFPPTLKRLSLKGTKCYNLPLDKSFLFNIQDYLPEIEYIDLSECEWLEPASLLPLSKVANLTQLIMRDCYRMSEFVAYASLATRYGFKKLEILDVRGSPLADSEVSALGWLGALRELYLAPAARAPPAPAADHAHYRDEALPPYSELEPWEMEEPEHFKIKPQTIEPPNSHANMTAEEMEQLREYENNLCLHGVDYNLCNEGAWTRQKSPLKRPSESSQDTTPDTQELPNAQPIIEVYLRGRQINREPPPAPNRPQPEPPEPQPKKMRVAEGLKNATSNDAGEGSSKTVDSEGSSKTEASSAISNSNQNEVKKDTEENTLVVSKVTWKRKFLDEAPTCSKENGTDSEAPSKKFKDDTSNGEAGPSIKLNNPSFNEVSFNKLKDTSGSEAGPSNLNNPSFSKTESSQLNASSNGTEEPGCSKDLLNNKSNDDPPNETQSRINKPGTSKDRGDEKDTDCSKPTEHPKGCKCKNDRKYEYVRFRQNMDPVIVRRDPEEVEREERERANENENREVRPRAHVLYVNVGQQLHTVYRLSIHNEPPIFYSFSGNSHLRFRPNVGNIFYTPPTPHLDGASLVSDIAVRRFGRADVTDENVVHIGLRGGGDQGARPNRSSLRVLSITGYRNITDRSLMHLATAAPELRVIDFSNTRVTARGVENFRSLRPDCEVKFSEYVEKKE